MEKYQTQIKSLGVFILLLVGVVRTQAQLLKGMVVDAQQNYPLSGATIHLKGSDVHAHTESNGIFQFVKAQIPDTLLVTYIGYAPQAVVVTNVADFIKIKLEKIQVDLQQVDVNGVKNPFSQIMKIDLYQTPVNTTQDLMRKVPGLFIAQHAGGGKAEQIFLRGFDADHGTDVNVSVDGMAVNMVSHAHGQGYADLHFVIPETVEDIDFGKGAYYADKGDLNTAGYVAFQTKDKLEQSSVKLEAGAFDSFRTLALLKLIHQHDDQKSQSTDAYVAAEYNFTNGPFINPQDFSCVNLFGKLNHWLNGHERLGMIVSTFNSNWNASGQIPERAIHQGLVPYFGSLDATEGGKTSRTNVQINYEKHLDEQHRFTSMAYYTQYQFSLFSNFTFFANNQDKGDEIHQYESRQIVGMDHRYTANTSLANAKLKYYIGTALRYDHIDDIGLDHVYRRNELLGTSAKGLGNEVNTNIYANADWYLGKWIVNPAVRADYFVFAYDNRLLQEAVPTHSTSAFRLSPKLNFFYNASSDVQLYLKSGLGFHSNDIRILTQETNAKNALPVSKGADLGATLKPAKGLIIQPALWYLGLDQEFVYVGDEAVVEPSGRSERYGLDMSIRYQPTKGLYIYTDWNWAHPRFLDLPATEAYIPLAPTLTSTGGATVQLAKPFSLSWSYRYMKDRPGNEDFSSVAKGYFVNDLTLTYQLKRLVFNLQCQNVFDVKWREAQFYTETRLANETQNYSDMAITPGVPRFIKGSVSFSF